MTHVLAECTIPTHYASADSPTIQTPLWIEQQWEQARVLAAKTGSAILALDEAQKVQGWSEQVKLLWDADTRLGRDVRAVIVGSSPLLMQTGLGDSLAGRFEIIPATHWRYPECHEAFGWDVETYIFYGGYPGAAPLIADPDCWRAYVADSLIETTLSRDILLMTRVDKPALLRQLFYLACEYSGQILSYTKMLGQLADAGNTTTLAHYLRLLAGAGLVTGLGKYSGGALRKRASSPKLQVMNTALTTALSGRTFEEARSDGPFWGRLVESAVGAQLLAEAQWGRFNIHYWRDGNDEVDFVAQRGDAVTAIEVKSGPERRPLAGLGAFAQRFKGSRTLLLGEGGIDLERYFLGEANIWGDE